MATDPQLWNSYVVVCEPKRKRKHKRKKNKPGRSETLTLSGFAWDITPPAKARVIAASPLADTGSEIVMLRAWRRQYGVRAAYRPPVWKRQTWGWGFMGIGEWIAEKNYMMRQGLEEELCCTMFTGIYKAMMQEGIVERGAARCTCKCGCRRRPGRRITCPRCLRNVGPGCYLEPCWDGAAGCCHMCFYEPIDTLRNPIY